MRVDPPGCTKGDWELAAHSAPLRAAPVPNRGSSLCCRLDLPITAVFFGAWVAHAQHRSVHGQRPSSSGRPAAARDRRLDRPPPQHHPPRRAREGSHALALPAAAFPARSLQGTTCAAVPSSTGFPPCASSPRSAPWAAPARRSSCDVSSRRSGTRPPRSWPCALRRRRAHKRRPAGPGPATSPFATAKRSGSMPSSWLAITANGRIHAPTKARPCALLAREALTPVHAITPYNRMAPSTWESGYPAVHGVRRTVDAEALVRFEHGLSQGAGRVRGPPGQPGCPRRRGPHPRAGRRRGRTSPRPGRCPACAAAGSDAKGDHLVIYPDGGYGCVANPKDKLHTKEIFRQVGPAGAQVSSTKITVRAVNVPVSSVLMHPEGFDRFKVTPIPRPQAKASSVAQESTETADTRSAAVPVAADDPPPHAVSSSAVLTLGRTRRRNPQEGS